MISKCTDRFSQSEIDDEIVLMQIDTGEFFSLQGTGREIWQLIDEAGTRDTLLAALAARFDAPEAMLAADLDEFLRALASAGFIAHS
jgi:pyrroloquinoline quinone biosynthesis protein D